MDTLQYTTGGFPLSTDRLADMQSIWQLLYKIANTYGDYVIIEGCTANKTARTNGTIVMKNENGQPELLPFEASDGTVVGIFETTDTVDYQDTPQVTSRVRRVARSMASPRTAVDCPWTSFKTIDNLTTLTSDTIRRSYFEQSMGTLRQQVNTLQTALNSLSAGTELDLSGMQKMLAPKGSIIMWAGALPLTATSLADIQKGMGAAVGYIPCGRYSANSNILTAWNKYLADIGAPSAARFNVNATEMNFTGLSSALGITVPDLRGRMPIGSGQIRSDYTNYYLGQTGGEETHALTLQEMPRHNHTFKVQSQECKHSGSRSLFPRTDGNENYSTAYTGSDTTAEYSRSGKAHNNMPPYYALNFLIKAI